MDHSREMLKRGLADLEAGNYQDALDTLLPHAEGGVPEAQAAVGLIYQLGLGVDRNIKSAVTWLEQAANQGNGAAAHNLGTLYLTCEPDLPVDADKSRYWYEKAKHLGFIVGTQ